MKGFDMKIINLIKKVINKYRKYEIEKDYDEVYMKELEYGHEINSNNYKELTEDDYESLASWYEDNYKEMM